MTDYVLGIDQGATETKALIFDTEGRQLSMGVEEVSRSFPRPSWVEQDPKQIWGAMSRPPT